MQTSDGFVETTTDTDTIARRIEWSNSKRCSFARLTASVCCACNDRLPPTRAFGECLDAGQKSLAIAGEQSFPLECRLVCFGFAAAASRNAAANSVSVNWDNSRYPTRANFTAKRFPDMSLSYPSHSGTLRNFHEPRKHVLRSVALRRRQGVRTASAAPLLERAQGNSGNPRW